MGSLQPQLRCSGRSGRPRGWALATTLRNRWCQWAEEEEGSGEAEESQGGCPGRRDLHSEWGRNLHPRILCRLLTFQCHASTRGGEKVGHAHEEEERTTEAVAPLSSGNWGEGAVMWTCAKVLSWSPRPRTRNSKRGVWSGPREPKLYSLRSCFFVTQNCLTLLGHPRSFQQRSGLLLHGRRPPTPAKQAKPHSRTQCSLKPSHVYNPETNV